MAHVPVLYQEVLDLLRPRPGGQYIDGTLGAGGHSAGLLTATAPSGRVLALDRDTNAVAFAQQRLAHYHERVTFIHTNYADMAQIAPQHGFDQVDGILLDLGLSSRQLDSASRGFSFRQEATLDMRFDTSQGETAADLINNLSSAELADLFWQYGEERHSRRYARAIIAHRPLQTTTQLAALIAQHAPRSKKRIHPATQVFQALRIAVNDELGSLKRGLPAALTLLKPTGRVAIISFHSLEDRFVKQQFRQLSQDCICPPQQPLCTCDTQPTIKRITRKVIKPSPAEIQQNPRSRSARLRVAEKL